jgi:hypothetical protein
MTNLGEIRYTILFSLQNSLKNTFTFYIGSLLNGKWEIQRHTTFQFFMIELTHPKKGDKNERTY